MYSLVSSDTYIVVGDVIAENCFGIDRLVQHIAKVHFLLKTFHQLLPDKRNDLFATLHIGL